MMMAFDSNAPPPRNELDPATAEAMRAAIVRVVAAAPRASSAAAAPGDGEAALQETLRRVAREARERAIPPERLLVMLKGMWHAAAAERLDMSRDVLRAEQDRRLRDFVTLCIAEYFRET